jgi:uncharacterized membrane protein (UPF0127 family)
LFSARSGTVHALVDEQQRVVCGRCEQAISVGARMRGLLGRSGLDPGEGLLFPSTSSIHMFFMKFPIDAVFLDREMRVRSIARDLAPWRIAGSLRRGSVLELAAGEARRAGIEPGMQLSLRREPAAAAATQPKAVGA